MNNEAKQASAKYAEFHQRSIAEPDAFWGEEAALIDWKVQPSSICDYSHPPFTKWFGGGVTNLCHNAVDRHAATCPNGRALIFISTETGTEKVYSFAELKSEVMRMAKIMKGLGVSPVPSAAGTTCSRQWATRKDSRAWPLG